MSLHKYINRTFAVILAMLSVTFAFAQTGGFGPGDDFDPKNPGNPSTNSFDPTTGLVIVDDFNSGSLRTAVTKTISGYESSQVLQMIVQGNVSDYDFSIANDYTNCIVIDFSRCTSLTTVPSNAYAKNGTLQQIVLPSSVTSISSYAFNNASQLNEITCYATTPPTVGDKAFDGLPEGTIAYVPEASISLYENADGWKNLIIKAAKSQYAVDFKVSNIAATSTSYGPGDEITINWTVQNAGTSTSEAGWRELFYLKKGDELSPLLHTEYYNSVLNSGESVNRTVTFTLPELLGVDGNADIQVTLVPSANAGETSAAQQNNIAYSADSVNISKKLYLSMSSTRFVECNTTISVMLKRSGSWSKQETFTIATEGDARMSASTGVTINEGQSAAYFSINLKDNDLLDTDSLFSLSINGNGYETLKQNIVIIDDEHPKFTITAHDASGKDVVDVSEGDSFIMHIVAERAPANDLAVSVSSDLPKRFSYPSQVTLKSGETELDVEVKAIDDDVSDIEQVVTFSVSAAEYERADFNFTILDNDAPTLELILTPNIVSEAAETNAVQGVIRRTTNVNKSATIRLSDTSDGGLNYNTNTLVMDKGVEEVQFAISPVDNKVVDGQRTYTITAAVYSASCSCSATEHTSGYVTADLTVLDDDGPTINIKSSGTNVKEGETATFTISRNMQQDEDVTVTISSNDDSYIKYDHTVTIPAGQNSIDIQVSFLSNEVVGDGHLVTFTATADGFAMGTCAIYVTDQSLPDAVVKDLKADDYFLNVGDSVSLTYTVKNAGISVLPDSTDVYVYFGGEVIASQKLNKALAAGEEITLTATTGAVSAIGVQDAYVCVNPEKTVQELSYANNTSDNLQILVSSPFKVASVKASETKCSPGDNITISGQLEGEERSISKVDVEVYYMINGYRMSTRTMSDASGKFSTNIKLVEGLYGSYTIGACYPDENVKTVMETVNVLGLTVESGANPGIILTPSEVKQGTIAIHNPASVDITDVKLTYSDVPDNMTFKASMPSTIPAESTVNISYALTGTSVSDGDDWQTITLDVTSKENAALQLQVRAFVNSSAPELVAYSNSFNLNVTQDTTTTFCINVKNNGKGSTGPIHLTIPSSKWITAPRTTFSELAFGDELSIPIDFTPTSDMPLNSEYKTQFCINGENGGSLVISGKIKVVSETTGRVYVDVVDEGTYYYPDEPHVSGATVQIYDPYSLKVVASGTTDDKGEFLSDEIPCGSYICKVNKDGHGDKTDVVYVQAAAVDSLQAFLAIAPITYSWQVVPTTVEDEYEFKLVTTYETQVPTPVVIIDFANELPTQMEVGDSASLMATVTNYGLVEAEDVNVHFAEHPMFDVEAQVKHFDKLMPGTTEFVPIVVKRKEEAQGAKIRKSSEKIVDCTASLYMEMYAGFRRRCNYATGNWDTIQVTKDIKLPTPHVNCKIVLPEWNIQCIPVPVPNVGGVGDRPTKAGPGNYIKINVTKLEKEAAHYEDVVQPLGDCIKDCWLHWDDTKKDWYDEMKDLIEAAKDAGKLLSVSKLRANLNPMWSAAKLGWQTGKWIQECLVPLVPGLFEAMYGDGSQYAAKQHRAEAKSYEGTFSLTDEQINEIATSYKMYHDLEMFMDSTTTQEQVDSLEAAAESAGYAGLFYKIEDGVNRLTNVLEDVEPGGCTKVKVEFTQTAMFTREAFEGMLTISNNSKQPIDDLELKFRIEDYAGNDCSSLFQIDPNHKLTGVTVDSDGKGTIDALSSGTYDILFIPTKYAAPTAPTKYRFTGTISFTNPFNGVPFSETLHPVTLTVNPTPNIDVDYFLQRDVLGDDALTDEVEPSVPSELSLLLNNNGYGDANNVRFAVKQPEIVENEKNLIIDFSIVSSCLNGTETNDIDVTSKQSIVNFGNIPAHSTSYAQWGLTSSLLGHFADYDVTYTHLTSYDNDSLSILGNVAIHELIRSLDASLTDKTLKGFLVNDIEDSNDEPDAIYLSDGTKQNVYMALDAQLTKVDKNVYQLTVDPATNGWNYKNILTPTGKRTIQKVVRVSDGQEMNVRNFWVTNVTINDLLKPTYEDRLHMAADFASTDKETYEITFAPRADVVLEVASITGIPETDYAQSKPVTEVTVKFNKTIDPKTFTTDDISLMLQGEQISTGDVKITSIDAQTFTVDLSDIPAEDGFYVLTIQTSGIVDTEGYAGESGKSVNWILYQSDPSTISEIVAISQGKSIYTLGGILISSVADKKTIESLRPGIYIIEGKKYLIK